MKPLLVSRSHHIDSLTCGLAVREETLEEIEISLDAFIVLLNQQGTRYRWIVFCYVHRYIITMVLMVFLSLRCHWVLVALSIILLTELIMLSREDTIVPLFDSSLIEFLLLVLK